MSWVSHHERKVKKIDFIHCFVHKVNSSSYDAIKARCAVRWLITEVNDTFKKWKKFSIMSWWILALPHHNHHRKWFAESEKLRIVSLREKWCAKIVNNCTIKTNCWVRFKQNKKSFTPHLNCSTYVAALI